MEFGSGLALGKRLMVVGFRENVFHCLPRVEFFQTWEETLDTLRVQATPANHFDVTCCERGPSPIPDFEEAQP